MNPSRTVNVGKNRGWRYLVLHWLYGEMLLLCCCVAAGCCTNSFFVELMPTFFFTFFFPSFFVVGNVDPDSNVDADVDVDVDVPSSPIILSTHSHTKLDLRKKEKSGPGE